MSHHDINIHSIFSALIADGIICEDNFRPYPLIKATYREAYKQALIDSDVHPEDVIDIMRKIDSELAQKDTEK
jgi:PP-loop superfamily ATP-utilizing enzyme